MTPEQLRAARESLGLSPTEMAAAMGVPYDTFKNYQSGRRDVPPVVAKVVELLQLVADLIEERKS